MVVDLRLWRFHITRSIKAHVYRGTRDYGAHERATRGDTRVNSFPYECNVLARKCLNFASFLTVY